MWSLNNKEASSWTMFNMVDITAFNKTAVSTISTIKLILTSHSSWHNAKKMLVRLKD